jgi:hypothetical protein
MLGSPNDEAVVLWDLEPLSGDWTSILDGRMFISNLPAAARQQPQRGVGDGASTVQYPPP